MGFDLHAKREDIEGFSMGAFSWSWMLDAGVGLPLGVGKGIEPASFVYDDRREGCVHYNDGAEVTEEEALQMAMVAEWVADYQDSLHDVWMQKPEAERQRMQDDHSRLYNVPVRRDFVEKVRKFAEWAKTSGGFTVH